MKLLASVLSAAAADYACCPYDDFGIPESSCLSVLNEKSPFSDPSGNALNPVESYACKAWEANAGAMSESHKGSANNINDWGSCGFQRHFPWYHTKNDDADDHVHKLGLWTDGGVAKYQVLATGGQFNSDDGGFNFLSLTRGSFSGATEGSKPVVGDVHLGAVCKLFVPVQKSSIRQVSVAGVHINNARIAGAGAHALSTEFNAAVIGNIANDDGTVVADYHAGTAYCFSVVNIAEFMTNRANEIANANVAGGDETARGDDKEWFADDIGFKYDNEGDQSEAQFGSVWPGFDQDTNWYGGEDSTLGGNAGEKNSGQHKVNMGSNFDVVVHFESSWCAAHWNKVDMQKSGDHGEGDATGHLAGFNDAHETSPTLEGLMDAWDKRLPAGTGSCGLCYDKVIDGVEFNPNALGVSSCGSNRVGGFTEDGAGSAEDMDSEFYFNYNISPVGDCVDVNGYKEADYRWPNAGAWAAFYSFVTCARSDYMIYGHATRLSRTVTVHIGDDDHLKENGCASVEACSEDFQDGTFALQSKTVVIDGENVAVGNNDNRMVVVGGWHQDYRHGQGACVRFNLRQVGYNVRYCADGDEERYNLNPASDGNNPTGDTSAWSQDGPKRCTWNWNYNILKDADDKEFDAESWFDSVDPLHQQVWASEEFVDEPSPGVVSPQASGYAAVLGPLVSDLEILVMIQHKGAGTFVAPTRLEMDAKWIDEDDNKVGFIDASDITEFAAADHPLTEVAVFDTTTAGAYATITVKCRHNHDSADPVSAYRASFPDCFFGDEIHGQWVWDSGLGDIDAASQTSVWRFWAMIKTAPSHKV